MINLKNLIVNGIVRLQSLLYAKDTEIKGGLNCGGIKAGDNNTNAMQPLYFENGSMKAGVKGVKDIGTISETDQPSDVSFMGEVSSQAGGYQSVVSVVDGIKMFTNTTRYMSSSRRMDLTLRNTNVSGSDTVLLTDNNWSSYVDTNTDDVEAGDGIITIKYNNATLGSFHVNQSNNTEINIPSLVKYPSRMTSSWTTAFRTQTKGDSENGSYVSVQRSDTSGISGMPQYGSYLAGGIHDTQFYIGVDWDTREAYFGGGNKNNLNWKKRIAFKEDILDSNDYLEIDASNPTVGTLESIVKKGSTTWNNGDISDNDQILIKSSDISDPSGRHTMKSVWDYVLTTRHETLQSNVGHIPSSEFSETSVIKKNGYEIIFWRDLLEAGSVAPVDGVALTTAQTAYLNAVYNANIQYCRPVWDYNQYRGESYAADYAGNSSFYHTTFTVNLMTPTQTPSYDAALNGRSWNVNHAMIKATVVGETPSLLADTLFNVLVPPQTSWIIYMEVVSTNGYLYFTNKRAFSNTTDQPHYYGIYRNYGGSIVEHDNIKDTDYHTWY